MKRTLPGAWRISGVIGLLLAGGAQAIEMPAVYNGSLDQPRINMMIRLPGQMDPLDGRGVSLPGLDLPGLDLPGMGGDITWNIEGFLDTGASGILIASAIAAPDEFNIPLEAGWIFEDVGVASTPTPFYVTQPLDIRLAPYNFSADIDNPPHPGAANDPANHDYFNNTYNHAYSGMRAIVGPINHTTPIAVDPLDELLSLMSQVNVFGMPLFKDKVAVFDARGLNNFVLSGGDFDLSDPSSFPMLQTYLYDPGATFNESTIGSNPGIPETQYHIRTSYADFTRFTRVTGDGAEMPAFAHNPFIGANPVNLLEGIPDDTPGITLGRDGQQATGSFLFDTGAAATIISTHLAEQLHIRYKPGEEPAGDNDDPRLQRRIGDNWVDLDDFEQFKLTIGGIDGTVQIAGFFLDDFSVPTLEGESLDFSDVPVLVFDVGTSDPLTGDTIVLDGIFGMNLLFATMFIEEPIDLFGLANAPMTPGAFDWVTFDEQTGIIGLSMDSRVIPEPATGLLLLTAGSLALVRRRR